MCSYDYESGYSERVECSDCREANDKLFNIERAMEQVVKLLYSDARLDVAMLDDAIGQVCDSLGYELPATMPRVRRQESEIFEFAMSINQ